MKISDFNERIQAFYENWTEEKDGDFKKILDKGGRFWAHIIPISPSLNTSEDKSESQKNRYSITMHKKHISNTRHAYLRWLGWNHKLLEIYTPWLEIRGFSYVKCLAKECIEEEHNG